MDDRININDYNPILIVWKRNMDIQFIGERIVVAYSVLY